MSRFLVRFGAPFALLGLVFLTINCKKPPAVGGKCTNLGRFICSTPDSALLCNGGTYEAISCRGARGCTGGSLNPQCDDDLAQLGDACFSATNDNYACATDHKSSLKCENGKFALYRTCKGLKGCTVNVKADEIDCDTSLVDVGDPCGTSGTYSCSSDHKMELMCQSEKFVPANSCRGPRECRIMDDKVHCDESVALEGDPCDTADEVTCSVDGKSMLTCKGSKFAHKMD